MFEFRRLPIAVFIAIGLISILQYRGIWNVTFMADDTMDFIQGTKIVKQEPWYPFIGKGMWRDGPQYYRPIPVLSHGIDAVVFGYWPAAHRAMQLALHLACLAAAYALYRSWFGKAREIDAALAALIFAVHPIHEHPMWWPGGTRNDVMCGIFYALTALCFTDYARTRSRRSLVWTLLATAAALACKEMAYTLPLVCFVVYLVFAPRDTTGVRRTWQAGLSVLPMIAVASAFMLFRLIRYDLGSTLLGVQFGPEHFRESIHLAVRGLIFPYQWSMREAWSSQPIAVGTALTAIAVLAALQLPRLRSPLVLLGVAWIGLGLLPVLRTMSPWALYIPSIGFCLILGHVLAPRRGVSGVAATVLLAVLLISYLVQWEQRRAAWGEMNRAADHTMTTLRGDYAREKFERAIFLDMPGSIGDVPLYMHYFPARLQFEMPDGAPKAIVLAIVIFPRGDDRQGVATEPIGTGAWKISLDSDKARFVFPEQIEGLYHFDTGNVGQVYTYAWGTSEVVAEHSDGQPSAVIVRLNDAFKDWAGAPIYSFSTGELRRIAH